ncbi:hypothetical protein VTN31DRAFT_4287 [Thermomyces dupontii]|uniref:uncharacterized protein n=1 Tax=Talaromyces thermophilus TaxID=28565 RepID=UPI0037449B28
MQQAGIVPGASTGAPAAPSKPAASTHAQRQPTSYNPSTGTGRDYTARDPSADPSSNNPTTTANTLPDTRQADTSPRQPMTSTGIVPDMFNQSVYDQSAMNTDTGDTSAEASAGEKIKGALAGIHGTGEAIRGKINASIDRTFKQPKGAQKNEEITQQGEYEVQSGKFSEATKEREWGKSRSRDRS